LKIRTDAIVNIRIAALHRIKAGRRSSRPFWAVINARLSDANEAGLNF